MICCDLNSPLADKALDVSACILDIWTAGEGTVAVATTSPRC